MEIDIGDIQMQIQSSIESCREMIEHLGKEDFYDEFDFPQDERSADEMIPFIYNNAGTRGDMDFEVGYLKGLELALSILMKAGPK